MDSLYAPDEFRVSDHDPVLIGNPCVDATFSGPLGKDGRQVKGGSTLPVKVVLTTSVGDVPAGLHLSVGVLRGDRGRHDRDDGVRRR